MSIAILNPTAPIGMQNRSVWTESRTSDEPVPGAELPAQLFKVGVLYDPATTRSSR
jgi:hypothetical protein